MLLIAIPCTADGKFLPPHSPAPQDQRPSWTPFEDRPDFEYAELHFARMETSAGNLDHELKIWAAKNLLQHGGPPPFQNAQELLAAIDAIQVGDAPWRSFSIRYSGTIDANTPSWKRASYVVHTRDSFTVVKNMVQSADFDKKFDYAAFREYTGPQTRRWSNVMSGQWAWEKSVRIIQHVVYTFAHVPAVNKDRDCERSSHTWVDDGAVLPRC